MEILIVLLAIAIILGIPIGIIAGIVYLVRRRGSSSEIEDTGRARIPVTWDRFLIYLLSVAGFMAALVAVSSLAGLVVAATVPQFSGMLSSQDMRTRASYYLAALIVGVPLWLGFWLVAQRRVRRSPLERNALERRLYLAGIFAVTAIVVLFASQALVNALLSLPVGGNRTGSVRDAVLAGIQILTYGVAWVAYARLGWREREPRDPDGAHDLAVYALAGFSLAFLSYGLGEAIRQIVLAILDRSSHALLTSASGGVWQTWGQIASWLLAGGIMWVAIWRYDLVRAGRRLTRVYYLYLVMLVAVPVTLFTGGMVLFELIRRIFGYQDVGNNWGFLGDWLPLLFVAAAVWTYHWTVVRRQASLSAQAPRPRGVILWPRRPAIAVLSFAGLAIATAGFATILWVIADFLLAGSSVTGGAWWRDRLSAGIAITLVGCAVWLPAWFLLQRAVRVDPPRELVARERRWLLSAVVLVGSLVGAAFMVAFLYQVLQEVLRTGDANTPAEIVKYLAVVVVVSAVAGYHWLVLRRESRLRALAPDRMRVAALIPRGAEATLDELSRRSGRQIETIGYLDADWTGAPGGLSTVEAELVSLELSERVERALLVLASDGATLYRYARPGARLLPESTESRPASSSPASSQPGESQPAPG